MTDDDIDDAFVTGPARWDEEDVVNWCRQIDKMDEDERQTAIRALVPEPQPAPIVCRAPLSTVGPSSRVPPLCRGVRRKWFPTANIKKEDVFPNRLYSGSKEVDPSPAFDAVFFRFSPVDRNYITSCVEEFVENTIKSHLTHADVIELPATLVSSASTAVNDMQSIDAACNEEKAEHEPGNRTTSLMCEISAVAHEPLAAAKLDMSGIMRVGAASLLRIDAVTADRMLHALKLKFLCHSFSRAHCVDFLFHRSQAVLKQNEDNFVNAIIMSSPLLVASPPNARVGDMLMQDQIMMFLYPPMRAAMKLYRNSIRGCLNTSWVGTVPTLAERCLTEKWHLRVSNTVRVRMEERGAQLTQTGKDYIVEMLGRCSGEFYSIVLPRLLTASISVAQYDPITKLLRYPPTIAQPCNPVIRRRPTSNSISLPSPPPPQDPEEEDPATESDVDEPS